MTRTIYDDLLSVHATKGDVLQMSTHVGSIVQCLIQALVKKGVLTVDEINAEMEQAFAIVEATIPAIKDQAEDKWRQENPEMASAWDEARNAAEAMAMKMGG